jgi:hypothetical protein
MFIIAHDRATFRATQTKGEPFFIRLPIIHGLAACRFDAFATIIRNVARRKQTAARLDASSTKPMTPRLQIIRCDCAARCCCTPFVASRGAS